MLPVLALIAILALSGCGGDDDSGDTAATEAAAGAETTEAENEDGDGEGQEQGAGDGKEQGQSKGDGKKGNGSEGSNAAPPAGEREPGITPEQKRKATQASITLESPAFRSLASIPAKFTCDGKNVSPPLRWKGLPAGAEELVLLALNFRPVNKELFYNWAVAGLDPDLTELEEGKLPAGAIVGENSFGKRGYGLCPPNPGQLENYVFMLFAIPEALDPAPGFEPSKVREEVLAQAGNVGVLSATYK